MINITKKQHFVPQFYLKQFAGENGMLCCYRKNDGKQFSAHPKDICFKDYGYEVQASHGKNKFILPNEIEKMFSMIEREYSTVLRSIVDKCLINLDKTALICTLKEKEVLASMVANFISRNFFVVNSFIDEDETLDLLQNKK